MDLEKLREITEKLNRSKLLKGMAYDVLDTFIKQQEEVLNIPVVIQRLKPKENKPEIPKFNQQGIKSCRNTNCMYLSQKNNCPWSKGDQLNCKDRKVLNDL